MSSALKPVLTSSGAQNPPVSSQLNKPMHPQGVTTAYGQPISHIPQNLVNNPHNTANAVNVHSTAHTNTHSTAHHVTTNAHNANHYSLNVPNAAQHYPTGAGAPVSTHSAPASNHPVSHMSQTHAQNVGTFSTPSKNTAYNPSYQANTGHTYKPQTVIPPTQSLPATQPQQPSPVVQEMIPEKPQSNGTPEVKPVAKPEPPQNHVTVVSKEKLQPVQQIVEKPKLSPATIPTPSESKLDVEAAKPPEVTITVSPAARSPVTTVSAVTTTPTPAPIVSTASVSTTAVNVPATVVPLPVATANSDPDVPMTCNPDENASTSTPQRAKEQQANVNQKATSTLKLATTPRAPARKARTPKPEQVESPKVVSKAVAIQKSPSSSGKAKRNRLRTQHYQSPLPEVELISKMTSVTTPRNRNIEDRLIIFYKNEFLAVRNSEGSFYVCQAIQNIYKSSPRIRIRWLSLDKTDKSGEVFIPDFYDYTDFDCILTNLNLERMDKGKFKLPASEKERTDSILKRALAVEKGDAKPTSLTEEHPDGLDLSLYKEESQLKKRKSVKRKASSPLKTAVKSTSPKKSPDQPKVQKIAPQPKPKPAKKVVVVKKVLAVETKKPTPGSRDDRATKRRSSQPQNSVMKTSPVVDQKKAKVLAKVARRTAITVTSSKAPPPVKTNVKPSKHLTVTKIQKITAKAPPATRKSKRGKK